MNDERFEELLQEMRGEEVSPDTLRAAQERVWQQLQGDDSIACDELRPELRDYARHRLAESRRLLIEDHLSRCVECRHALADIKGAGKVVPMPATRPQPRRNWKRWAAAAAIVVAVLFAGRGAIDSLLAPAGPRATVVALSGQLYQPTGALLPTGAEIGEGQVVRTAAGSRAVLELRDGSRVEMNQRTQLAVHSARSGDTIRLSWGDVIVEAADQGARNLRVITRDSIASVKGTVFAVSSGTAGSLVSVVEGSVEVSQGGRQDLLSAGQQAASTLALTEVGVVEAVSWSEEATSYYELLAELAQMEEQLLGDSAAMRRDARLLPYLPANASVYLSGPNLDGTLAEAVRLLDQRAAQSPTLAEWWLSESGQETRAVLLDLQSVTELLGEELVLVLTGSEEPIPLFLAEVRSGSAEQLMELLVEAADDPNDLPPVQVSDGLLLASDSAANLAMMTAQLGAGASSAFAAEIADHYARGVGLLAAVDVEVFNAAYADTEVSRLLGLTSMRYLFIEQRSGAVGDETEATLSFRGERQGMASWLSTPGPIGSAEYVSADAVLANGGSTRDPAEAFDQLMSLLGTDSEFMGEIRQIEQETGIDVRDDIAESLGTDFVVALEGMSITEPMWIAAFEVMNPGALDEAVRRMVQTVNANNVDADEQLTFTEEEASGRTWKVLSVVSTEGSKNVTWTYDRGYAVVSTSRDTALRAIAVRDSASSLIRSRRFQEQYPSTTGGVHNSGFLWLDVARVGEVLEALGRPQIGLAGDADPVLVIVTGEDDAISWATRTRLSSLLFDLVLM